VAVDLRRWQSSGHISDGEQHRGLSVEELVRRAQPLPSHEEMVIADLRREEAEAFLAAVKS